VPLNLFFFEMIILLVLLALEDQSRLTQELDDKRRQAEEAQLRLQQEREETVKQREIIMDQVKYEEDARNKIVCTNYFIHSILNAKFL
jgi:hypothetical protein